MPEKKTTNSIHEEHRARMQERCLSRKAGIVRCCLRQRAHDVCHY